MNNWYKEAVFYEINPRTFYDANGDGIGDLQGIIEKLDHIKSLGVDCIWLLPIFPSPLLDGGYDIEDYYGIHPHLGSLDDLQTLIDAVHARGMRLILDLVVNHTSDQCRWFKEAQADRNSSYRDYYVWSDTDKKFSEARIIFLDTEDSNWAWSEKAQQYYWHRFYSSQPDLNYDNPAVREEMMKIMRYWLDMGIDGFRADAVPYLYEREGTNCENLPETHAYLKEMRAMIDAEYPGRILLAEANQWPKDLLPYLADGEEFHMAFQFPVMPRIYKSLAIGSNAPLLEILKATPKIPEDCQWCIFLRNHDELTLEMVTEEDRQFMWDFYAPEARMRLNQGIRRRLAPLMNGDMCKVELLYAILFSLSGAPIIYYGDEIGMGDNIWLQDRDGVRTPMQWSDGKNAGFSDAAADSLYLPVIDEGQYRYQQVNVAKAEDDENSLLNRLRKLVAVRKAHPVFSGPEYKIIQSEKSQVFAIERLDSKSSMRCFHNLSNTEQKVSIDSGYRYLHASEDATTNQELLQDTIILKPFGYAWLIKE